MCGLTFSHLFFFALSYRIYNFVYGTLTHKIYKIEARPMNFVLKTNIITMYICIAYHLYVYIIWENHRVEILSID